MADPARPAGYPSAYEREATLADGRRVAVRPLLPGDRDELAEAIRTADAQTLHDRFLGAAPPLTDAMLDELTLLDYTTRFALVAREVTGDPERPGAGVGIARYIAQPPDGDGVVSAEVALAVAPAWRRVGLATALLGLLVQRAEECGIHTITALFLATNRPVAELARDAHARVFISEGIAELQAHSA